MEKISSILPSNGRIKSVDLAEAQPTRPGAPNYGSPNGVTSVRDRVSLSQSPREAAAETMTYKNPRERAKAKIVEDITNGFFAKRLEKPTAEKATKGSQALDLASEPPSFQLSGREAGELPVKSLEPAETSVGVKESRQMDIEA